MEDLSPESRTLYEILKAETREEYEQRFLDYTKKETALISPPTSSTSPRHDRVHPAVVSASSPTRSTASLRAPSSVAPSPTNHTTAATTSSATSSTAFSVRAATSTPVPAAASLDSAPASVFSRSTADTLTPPATSRVALTKHDLSPGARRIYDYIVGNSNYLDGHSGAPISAMSDVSTNLWVPTEVEDVHDAVDIGAADLAGSAPTSCSAECPTLNACVYAVELVQSPTPRSSTTFGGMVPTNCLRNCSVTPHVFEGMVPTNCLRNCSTEETCVLMPKFNSPPHCHFITAQGNDMRSDLTLQPPWPPPRYVIRCKHMIQALQLEVFILEHAQLMLSAVKNPWPPPFPTMSTGIQNILQLDVCQDIPFMPRKILFHLQVESVECIRSIIGVVLYRFSSLSAELLVFYLASCRIRNLHGTLDNMQLSGDCQVSIIMALKWTAIILVIIFVPGVPNVQLQLTMFKWSIPFFYDMHLHIASSSISTADRHLDLLLIWTGCYIDNLHWSSGSTALATTAWEILISSTWVLVNCLIARMRFQLSIAVQRYISSNEFLAILHGKAIRWHYSRTRVLFIAVHEGCISGHILHGDCLQYEYLQQWQPPDRTAEFLGVQFQCESRNMGSITSMKENVLAKLLQVYSLLCRWTSNHFQAELFVIEHWFILWDPGDVSPRHILMENFTSFAITCEMLYSVSLDDNFLTDCYWLWFLISVELVTDGTRNCAAYLRPKPPWPHFAPANSTSEFMSNILLHNASISVLGVAARPTATLMYLSSEFSWITEIYSERRISWTSAKFKSLSFELLHWKTIGLLAWECSACCKRSSQQLFEWHIPWNSCPGSAQLAASGHWKLSLALLFSWDMSCPIDSETSIKHICSTSSHALQYLETGDCFPLAILLVSSSLSQAWVIYLHVADILHWGSKLMTWEVANSEDGILTYTNRVFILWDPGGLDPAIDAATGATWYNTQLQDSHLPWDPVGYTQQRLEGKPNLKEGGLSATTLLSWLVGRNSWAVACSRARRGEDREAYILGRQLRGTLAWNGTDWTAASAEAWLGQCCVWRLYLLLPPSILILPHHISLRSKPVI